MKTEKRELESAGRTLQSNWLTGRFEHALDIKSRLIVPSEWRNTMGSPLYVYIMRSPHSQCLWLMPPSEMEQKMARLREMSMFDSRLDDAMRSFGNNSQQVMLDVQGRIRIHDRHLEFAALTEKSTKVVMIGMGQKAEIWSSGLAPQESTEQRAYADDMAYLRSLGI